MSLNSRVLSFSACARPNCFPAVVEVVVGITNKIHPAFHKEAARAQPWGFGRDEG